MPGQIYGFLSTGGGRARSVESGGTGMVASGFRGTSREATAAHEMTHNFDTAAPRSWGRHVPNTCGAGTLDDMWPYANDDIQEVSFDTRTPWVDGTGTQDTVLSSEYPDYMSYCQSDDLPDNPSGQVPTKWLSPYRWEALFDNFPNASFCVTVNMVSFPTGNPLQVNSGHGGDLDPRFDPQQITEVLYVSGTLRANGRGKLRHAFTIDGIANPSNPNGPYAIEMLDDQGQPLSRFPFNASFEDSEGVPLDALRFNYQMPLPANETVSAIRLMRNNTVLDRINVSASTPVVRVAEVQADQPLAGEHTFRWSAQDPDKDELRFMVFYSPGPDQPWQPLAARTAKTRLTVDTRRLPGGAKARIRVMATDGFNTAQDTTDVPFAVAPKPPKVRIRTPRDGQRFEVERPIRFQGRGRDLEDGALPDAQLRWSAGAQVLGEGRRVRAFLPPGEHAITLTGRDKDGMVSSKTVTITVDPKTSD